MRLIVTLSCSLVKGNAFPLTKEGAKENIASYTMNCDVVPAKPISEKQLPERFASPDYQVLLVANKSVCASPNKHSLPPSL